VEIRYGEKEHGVRKDLMFQKLICARTSDMLTRSKFLLYVEKAFICVQISVGHLA